MSALLDLQPDFADAMSAGVADLHGVIDGLHAAPTLSVTPSSTVVEVDRAIRRLEALKLKMVAAADQAGTARDAGFTDTNAWVAKTTTVSRSDAARQVALANDLSSDHDATAEALDAGLVSPGHAAVIVQATRQLPDTVSSEQRQVVEAHLVENASPVTAPTSSAASPVVRSRLSNPTRASSTPTRTSWSVLKSKRRRTSARSRCTTTATAPAPDTSPSPPSPQRSWPRSWTR